MHCSEQLTIFQEPWSIFLHLVEPVRDRVIFLTSENLTIHDRIAANLGEPDRNLQNLAELYKTLWNLQEPVEPYTTILNIFLVALFSPLKHCRTLEEPCGTFKKPKESGRTLSTLSERQKTQSNLMEHFRTLKNLLLKNPRTSANLGELQQTVRPLANLGESWTTLERLRQRCRIKTESGWTVHCHR